MSRRTMVAVLVAAAVLAPATVAGAGQKGPEAEIHGYTVQEAGKGAVRTLKHFVDPYYVRPEIRKSNAGGECGAGWRNCTGMWSIYPYLGGDRNPKVGAHSLQFSVTFNENFGLVGDRYRTCVQRWYHYSFGETYFCHDGWAKPGTT